MLAPTGKLWRVTGSSVRGTSHIKGDLPCQDAHEWESPESGLLIAAAADGAGSAKESHVGARVACRAAVEFLAREPQAVFTRLPQAAEQARNAVLAEAGRLSIAPRELACTLIILAATANKVGAVQIGDGAALVLTSEDELRALTLPAESEYLNETLFLSSDLALESAQVKSLDLPVRGVALFTDGLQMLALKMPERLPHMPFFEPLFRFVTKEGDPRIRIEQIERLLRSPKLTQRTDDDLTLLLATLQ